MEQFCQFRFHISIISIHKPQNHINIRFILALKKGHITLLPAFMADAVHFKHFLTMWDMRSGKAGLT